jgi:Glycosyl hydrolase family 26
MTAKFVPRVAGQTLLFLGQDNDSVAEYRAHVSAAPSGVTTYTCLRDTPGHSLNGLTSFIDYGAGPVHATQLLETNPHAALAIGLDLVDTCASVAAGKHDHHLDTLSNFISSTNRAVFLRIGYEADGPWNRYTPADYVAAFRRIVHHIRDQRKVSNVVFVWQLSMSSYCPCGNEAQWWPGDDVVDWCGGSYFDFHEPSWNSMLAFARHRGKPIMICETAPRGYDTSRCTVSSSDGNGEDQLPVTPDNIWNDWFANFFRFVYTNRDVVRAIAYINCAWHLQRMWCAGAGQGWWGDTRVNANPALLQRWVAEIERPGVWMSATADLTARLNA